jgi:hypothetical protein
LFRADPDSLDLQAKPGDLRFAAARSALNYGLMRDDLLTMS